MNTEQKLEAVQTILQALMQRYLEARAEEYGPDHLDEFLTPDILALDFLNCAQYVQECKIIGATPGPLV